MPLTIDLSPAALAALTQFAEDRGVTAEQLAASVVGLHFPPLPPPRDHTPEELAWWDRHLEALREAHPPAPPCPPPPMTPRRRAALDRLQVLDEEYDTRFAPDEPAGGGDDGPAGLAAWEANEKRLERGDGGLNAAEAAADRVDAAAGR